MGWLSNPKRPWNWSERGQITFIVTTAFLQFTGGVVIWFQLYDMAGNKVPIGPWDAVVGLIGVALALAGAIGALAMAAIGFLGLFKSLLIRLTPAARTWPVRSATLPWIASVVSFTFGAFILDAVISRPGYFRDEILGILATLLVAFAASHRSIEVFSEPAQDASEEQ